jgi:hypothetical protein
MIRDRRPIESTLLVVTFAVAILSRFSGAIALVGVLPDEQYYVDAFAAVNAGRDPFTVAGYVYPYPFALVGAWAVRTFGAQATLVSLRALDAVGIAVVLGLAVSAIERRLLALTVGVAIILFAPSVWHCVEFGNLSGLAVGLGLPALVLFRRRPALAGLLLGLSLATKPLLFSGWAALVGFALRDRRARLAAAIAASTVLATLAVRPSLLSSMLHVRGDPSSGSLLSLYRAAFLLGIPLSPLVLIGAGAIAAGYVGATRLRDARTLALFAAVASALSQPYLWKHTLLLLLPLQVLSFVVALDRRSRSEGPARERASLLVAGLALANAFLLVAEALPLMAAARWPNRLQGVLVLLLVAVPLLLFASVVRREDRWWVAGSEE